MKPREVVVSDQVTRTQTRRESPAADGDPRLAAVAANLRLTAACALWAGCIVLVVTAVVKIVLVLS